MKLVPQSLYLSFVLGDSFPWTVLWNSFWNDIWEPCVLLSVFLFFLLLITSFNVFLSFFNDKAIFTIPPIYCLLLSTAFKTCSIVQLQVLLFCKQDINYEVYNDIELQALLFLSIRTALSSVRKSCINFLGYSYSKLTLLFLELWLFFSFVQLQYFTVTLFQL